MLRKCFPSSSAIEPTPTTSTPQAVNLGDKLKVYYGPTHESKVTYEAKVLEIEKDASGHIYLVHYLGWNTRYDEWIQPQRIAENLSAVTKAKRLKQGSGSTASTSKVNRLAPTESRMHSSLSRFAGVDVESGHETRPRHINNRSEQRPRDRNALHDAFERDVFVESHQEPGGARKIREGLHERKDAEDFGSDGRFGPFGIRFRSYGERDGA